MNYKKIFSLFVLLFIQTQLLGNTTPPFNNHSYQSTTDSLKKGFKFSSVFDEINISFNRNDESRYNEYPASTAKFNMLGFGFGISIHRAIIKSNHFELIAGFAYNQNNQYRKRLDGVNFLYDVPNSYNMPYFNFALATKMRLNNLSIPLTARIMPFNKPFLFIDAGFFLDLPLKTRISGTQVTVKDSYNGQTVTFNEYHEEFNAKYKRSEINYGPTLGIGSTIPFNKTSVLIKAEYKYGLNNIDSYYSYDNGMIENGDHLTNTYYRLLIGFKIN